MIVIIDYGLGNLRSILKVCKSLTDEVIISSNKKDIDNASKIILPGVGHFETAMKNLNSLGLIDTLNHNALIKNKPILGICLGMQIMTSFSEEGSQNGLDWIKGNASAMKVKLRVPQVGWNSIKIQKINKLLSTSDIISNRNEFFFVHSYFVNLKDKKDGLFETTYSNKTFYSGFSKNNIYGVQFHPEKSYEIGIKLISNFVKNV